VAVADLGGSIVTLNEGAQTFTYRANNAANFEGDASFRYTISDGSNEASGVVSFPVINRAPVIADPGPQQVTQGDKLTLQLSAIDPDEDFVSFSIEQGPGLNQGVLNLNSLGLLEYDTSGATPQRVQTMVVGASDGIDKSTLALDITITPQDPNHRIITFDDTDATADPGWALLSSIAGCGPTTYGNIEGTVVVDRW
jgi:hypothetical protein